MVTVQKKKECIDLEKDTESSKLSGLLAGKCSAVALVSCHIICRILA
jgi:hypothetical protein